MNQHPRRRFAATVKSDRGSLPLVLLMTLVGLAVAALLLPLAITQVQVTVKSQAHAAATQTARSAVNVASSKVLQTLRTATGGYVPPPTMVFTGADRSGEFDYRVDAAFYHENPHGRSQNWLDTHQSTAATVDDSRYVLFVASVTDDAGITVSAATDRRVLELDSCSFLAGDLSQIPVTEDGKCENPDITNNVDPKPTNVAAKWVPGGGGDITVTWGYAGSSAGQFTIERTTAGGTGWSTLGSVDGYTYTYTDTSPELSGQYTYRVLTDNTFGTYPSSTVTVPALATMTVTTGVTFDRAVDEAGTAGNLDYTIAAVEDGSPVDYTSSGNTVTVSFSGGDIKGSNTNPRKYAKDVSGEVSGPTGSLPGSTPYSSDGFTGTLYPSGSPDVTSGVYIPPDTKYVSGQMSRSYSSGGYHGTLSSYVYSGHDNYTDTRYVSYGVHRSGHCPPTNLVCAPRRGYHCRSYSSGGYHGTVCPSNYRYYDSDTADGGFNWSRNWTMSGTLTRYFPDTRVWRYHGYVTKPAFDNRIWHQKYAGTAYKPGDSPYYSYTATVYYVPS